MIWKTRTQLCSSSNSAWIYNGTNATRR